jgi:CRP-like cAMP-binding protein
VPAATNAFLDALPKKDSGALGERLKRLTLSQGQVLGESGAAIEQVVFPLSGLISVVAELSSGERIETALIGRGGVFGASIGFGAKIHISTSFVQMAGEALAIRASEFADFARNREDVKAQLYRHEQYLMAQAQQSVACNARHQISERLAAWLLRARDAAETGSLHLTQEFLAQMLGVQRASVSVVASSLQDAGMIAYRRGRIDIIDDKKLSQTACECHHTVHTQHQRLLGDISARD